MIESPTQSQSGLFDLAEQRLTWLGQRQKIIAQNIANADTPNWRSRDIAPFASYLSGAGTVAPVLTNPAHLQGTLPSLATQTQRPPERAPDGNEVSVENELIKVAQNDTTQALTGNLWKSYMGMVLTALGKGG
jgi:flagellar basal-body rod protein FlgB